METIEINLHSGKKISYYVCQTFYDLLTGDIEGLQNLLSFGYSVDEYRMAIWNADFFFNSPPKFKFRCQDYFTYAISEENFTTAFNARDQIEHEDDEFPDGFFRQSVIHEVILFLLIHWHVSDPKVKSLMVKGFLLVWRSRPTPYVRIHEVFCELKESWISEDCPEKCGLRLYQACEEYKVLFSDMALGFLKPRSLKHLSRCAVRCQLMRTVWSFGIEKLNVPKRIKSYLRLQS